MGADELDTSCARDPALLRPGSGTMRAIRGGRGMHREDAWKILLEYSQEERTRKHGIAVEATMQAYAKLLHDDVEKWGIVGLLHDFDWEIHPTADLHPKEGSKLLEARGVPADIRYAILCHAPFLGLEYSSTDGPRDLRLR